MEKFDGLPDITPVQLIVDPATQSATLQPILDGDTVALNPPVQGGYVLYVGAIGHFLSQRSASLLGELRRSQASDGTPLTDPGRVMYSDARSVQIVPSPTMPGLLQVPADPNEVTNIAPCPNTLDVDVVDNPLFLVVTYSDAEGRSAQAVRTIVPSCTQMNDAVRASCICQCLAGYTTDRCYHPPDAGVDAGVDGGADGG